MDLLGLWPKKGQVAEASKSFFLQLDTCMSHAQKNHLLSFSCSYIHSTAVSQKQRPESLLLCHQSLFPAAWSTTVCWTHADDHWVKQLTLPLPWRCLLDIRCEAKRQGQRRNPRCPCTAFPVSHSCAHVPCVLPPIQYLEVGAGPGAGPGHVRWRRCR